MIKATDAVNKISNIKQSLQVVQKYSQKPENKSKNKTILLLTYSQSVIQVKYWIQKKIGSSGWIYLQKWCKFAAQGEFDQ